MQNPIRTAFVLAAGYGSRLRPLTDLLPKPLLPVGNSSALFKIFDKLAKAGVERAIVNTHHLGAAFDAAFKPFERGGKILYRQMEIVKIFEPDILDTGGGIKNAYKLLKGDELFLAHNADIIFNADIAEFMRRAQKIFAATNCAAVLCLRGAGANKNVGVAGGAVCDMRFTTGARPQKNMQYTGVFVASQKFLRCAKSFRAQKFSNVDVFLKLMAEGEQLRYVAQDGGKWLDIGGPAQYLAANKKRPDDIFKVLAKVAAMGFVAKDFSLIDKGASSRNFLRFADAKTGRRLVACVYSKQKREDALYAPIAKFLRRQNIAVPDIEAACGRRRVMVMRDGGTLDLLKLERENPNKNAAIYRQVLQNLKILHTTATAAYRKRPFELSQPFNAALYDWEQNYFTQECMLGKFGMRAGAALKRELAGLKKILLKQKTVLLHRDCQSQNVMVENGKATLIDFQGMRLGCALYDVASLLFDPYVRLSDSLIAELSEFYFGAKPTREQTQMLYYCACQRLMQALGAFGFLSIKKGKAEYANYFEPALKRLIACARAAKLAALKDASAQMLKKLRSRGASANGI